MAGCRTRQSAQGPFKRKQNKNKKEDKVVRKNSAEFCFSAEKEEF